MKTFSQAIQAHLRTVFLAGLLFLVPVILTYLVLKSLFLWVDGLAQPFVRRIWQVSFPGLGILLSLFFLYGVGFISTNILGRTLVQQGERIVLRIPLVKVLYQSFKEFMQIFLAGTRFRGRVVLVEYPMKGRQSLAFLTNTCQGADGRKRAIVLIPTVPNPTNGSLAIFPQEEVTETVLTLEEASWFFLSAGILGIGSKSKNL